LHAESTTQSAWREVYKNAGTSWEADSDLAQALIFEARGQYREAEAAYRRSEAFRRVSVVEPVPAACRRQSTRKGRLS